MSRNTKLIWVFMAFILLGLTACGGGTPTTDPSLAYTQIWKNVADAQTQTALVAPSPTPRDTNTPTISPTPQATNTPLLTYTPMPGVPTSTPLAISTSAGTQSTACDNASFITDVTIPDNTEIPAGSSFVKTWQFKNMGPCSWTTGYRLVYNYVSDSGKNGVFTPPGPVYFPNAVLPGENLDISVTMTAPTKAGTYQVYFVLQNNNGFLIPLSPDYYIVWVLFIVP